MEHNHNDLKEQLNKKITLPKRVEDQVQKAYQEIQQKNANEQAPNKKKTTLQQMGKWVAAAAAVVLVSTTAVLAATGFFSKEVIEEGDRVTYQFDLNYELVPGDFAVTANYLPEGMVQQEEGKYCSPENFGHGISILPIMNTIELEKQGNLLEQEGIENIEKTTLSNVEAHVITLREEDKYLNPKYIYLFNEAEGYVLEIYGDYVVPLEELKKFADNLTITRTGDAEIASDQEKEVQQKELAAQEQADQEWDQLVAERHERGILADELIAVGEEEAGFTVKSAKFMDHMPIDNRDGFVDYEELAPWLAEDGSLKPYLRQHFDQEGALLAEEMVNQKILAVDVAVKKHRVDDESLDKTTAMDATIKRLTKRADGSYTWATDSYAAVPQQQYYLQTDNRCIYFDQPEFTATEVRNQFFYRTLAVGDELNYTLFFIVDEDVTDELVLEFNECATSEIDAPTYYRINQ